MSVAADHERDDLEGVVLVARRPCGVCDGRGDRVSDDWEAFREWQGRQSARAFPDQAEHYFLYICDYASVPPMRQDCGECDGSGHIDSEVDVKQLVAVVLSRVDRPIVLTDDLQDIVRQVRQSITNAAQMSAGLTDGPDIGSYLRAVQEGAEALRALQELAPAAKDQWDI